MVKTASRNDNIGDEPRPMFATAIEIAVAEALRHQLEERYFGSSVPKAQMPTPASDVH